MDREVFMAEPKTKLSDIPVADFINAIPDAQIRQDCWTIVEIMQEATQAPPRMWGKAILGFGQYHAVHASGKGNDWMVIGFSPRKQAITLYLMLAGIEPSEEILARLGKYTRGKGCLLHQAPLGCRYNDPQGVGSCLGCLCTQDPSCGWQLKSRIVRL
jgi:hypothetical protein